MKDSNNMKCIAGAVMLLGCIASGNAVAQDNSFQAPAKGNYNPSWYIAPSLNGMNPDDKFGTDHRGGGVGLRVGKPIAESWDIQFGTTYSRAHTGESSIRENTLGADALYLFSRGRIRPFLLIGGGAEYDKYDRPGSKGNRYSPYANAGLGVQYSFNNQWGMQADVRYAETFIRGNSLGFDRAHGSIATLAVTYAFDKPAAPAPVVRAAPAQAEPVVQPVVVVVQAAPATPVAPPRFERHTLSSTELFSFDSAELRSAQPKLDEISDVLTRDATITNVNIIGYTDRLGSEKYNQKLSQRRADAVKTYMTNKGIDGKRLTATGRGESNPVVECSEKGRSALIKCLEPNRRVEVEQIVIERRVP
ncbi:MAG: outer membrane protein precursor [Proteobacteria bacterium]|nr:outer membrane protein precursor [Pseudomonadota bacterium]